MQTARYSYVRCVVRIWTLLLLWLLGGFDGSAGPLAPGQLDPNYRPRFERSGAPYRLHATTSGTILVELPPDGVRINGTAARRLARMQQDGTIDPTFHGPAFLTNASFSQVLAQADGRIWIEYSTTTTNYPVPPARFLRLRADGSQDDSFQLPVRSDDEDWRLLAIQPNGGVLAAVNRPAAPAADRHKLLRLQSDGSVDPFFASAVDEGARTVSAQPLPDGGVLVEYVPISFGDGGALLWTRLQPDGSLDETYFPPSKPNRDFRTFHAISPAGEVLIAYYSTYEHLPNGGTAPTLPFVRLRVDGSLDPDFHPGFAPAGIVGFLPAGHVLVTVTDPHTTLTSVLELDHDGTQVREITLDAVAEPGSSLLVELLPDSGHYLAQDGHHSWLYAAAGDRFYSFAPAVYQAMKPPVPVAYADGSLLFGHGGTVSPAFDTVNLLPVSGPALVDQDGKIDLPFTTWFESQADWLAVPGAKGEVYVYDLFSHQFAAVSRDGSLRQLGGRGDTLPIGFSTDSGNHLQFQSDLSLIERSDNNLLRVRPSASTEYNLGILSPKAQLEGFLVLPDDSVLAWGYSRAFEGAPGNGIGRLSPDLRGPDAEFHSSLPQFTEVLQVEPQPDGKLLVFHDFFRALNHPHNYLLTRLNQDGSPDAEFNRHLTFDALVRAIKLDSQGRILVAGAFHTASGEARGGVLRLHPDGTPDNDFLVGEGPDAPIENLFVLPGDDVVLHGNFRHFNGEEAWGLVRLSGGPSVAASPRILSLTGSRTASAGESVSLGAVITGGPVWQAQWYLDGNALPGETNATLILRQVNAQIQGSYALFVANGEGADVGLTSLAVVPPVARPPSVALLGADGTTFPPQLTVGLTGDPTRLYEMQVSTNLTDWRGVFSGIYANTSGSFDDPFSYGPGPRFIRAVAP